MINSDAPVPPPKWISLKQRVLSAGAWSFGGYGVSMAIRLGSNLAMTRLLVPEAFGVMAVAIIIMSALAMFSDVGLRQSIVQNKRGGDPVFLNTAWVTQIFRGMILWFFAVVGSLSLALIQHVGTVPKNSVYADPILPYVIAAMSINFFISGFQSTKMYEASRDLSLGRVTKMGIAAQLVGLVCMITWAFVDRSIWALVAGSIGSTAASVVLAHVYLSGVANRWMWDWTAFREIFHFGKWIFLSSIMGFFASNGDRLLLAGFVNASVFGVYVIAFLIFNSVQMVLHKIIVDVSFPALSEIVRERPDDLKSRYYRFHIAIGTFTFFCSGVLMVSGHTLISLLYDPRYEQAGWMLEILAVALLPIPFRLAIHSLLALGLPKLFSHVITMQTVSLYVFIPLGFYFFGLTGALWAYVASYFAVMPITIIHKIRYKLFNFRTEVLMLLTWILGMLVAKGFNLAVGH